MAAEAAAAKRGLREAAARRWQARRKHGCHHVQLNLPAGGNATATPTSELKLSSLLKLLLPSYVYPLLPLAFFHLIRASKVELRL